MEDRHCREEISPTGWLDLIGECEQARGRLIEDMKVAVLLKSVPKEIRDRLVLESPQLADVDSTFPVMREVVQNWCRSRKTFAHLRSSVQVAAMSTAASEPEASVSALGKHGAWPEKEDGKGRGKEKAMRKGERKEKARATAGKEKADGGSNRSVVTVDSAGCWAIRRLKCSSWREVAVHTHLLSTSMVAELLSPQ